jgi:hypothetical protein
VLQTNTTDVVRIVAVDPPVAVAPGEIVDLPVAVVGLDPAPAPAPTAAVRRVRAPIADPSVEEPSTDD